MNDCILLTNITKWINTVVNVVHCLFMLVNTVTNVNKCHLIVKCYQTVCVCLYIYIYIYIYT